MPTTFLNRLARDTRGNTLAIVAASLIPLIAMIGSGIDMSRAYMAKTRLQSACDAASLAGRRTMTNDTLDANVKAEATKFFNFNFEKNIYGTANVTPVITKPESGTIKVTAATSIPTGVIHLFGIKTLPLTVECQASQNFVNTDIVLVLDSTGSMLCATTESSCSNSGEKSSSKIKALREAVLALYDELKPVQDELEGNGMRLRYGIVPYSSGVNVGGIVRAANANYIVSDEWEYNSRRPIYVSSDTETKSNKTQNECNAYRQSRTPSSGYPATEITVARASGNATRRNCYVTTTTWSLTSGESFSSWLYGDITWDVSKYVKGETVPTPSRHPFNESGDKSKWEGCIEERSTTSSITSSSGYTIPSGANDLNIDLIPTSSNDTKWRPYWPEVTYMPHNGSQPQVACPSPAKRLQKWTRSNLENYLDDLVSTGGTYHDNGMIWGARLISAGGIFGSDNPENYNGMPVSKHIIFMTDGMIDTGNTIYSTYGMEYWDERVTGGWTSDSDQTGRHEQRFKMMCNAIRGKNVSIWVVAFATTASSTLTSCASSSAQVSTSTNKEQLIEKFTEIGKNIGSLRLTK